MSVYTCICSCVLLCVIPGLLNGYGDPNFGPHNCIASVLNLLFTVCLCVCMLELRGKFAVFISCPLPCLSRDPTQVIRCGVRCPHL